MARQAGVIPLEGTIGGIIFYKSKHGYLARARGGIPRQRIAAEDRFARTRETGSEFGYASRVGKLLRAGIKAACSGAEDGDTNTRLAAKLMKIVQADTVNIRGERRLLTETASLMEGFEWKERAAVGALLRLPMTISVDSAAQLIRCRVEEIPAGNALRLPSGASHVILTLAAVRVDHAGNRQMSAYTESEALALSGDRAGELILQCALPAGGGDVLMCGVGIAAFQEVSRRLVELKEGCGFRVGKVVVMG